MALRTEDRSKEQDESWREPAQIVASWSGAGAVDGALLRSRSVGPWYDILDELDVSLLVSREYEHLLICLSTVDGRGSQTFMSLPHPSGIVFDRQRNRVHVASTRNPNQVIELEPAREVVPSSRGADAQAIDEPLIPLRSRYYPGSLYLHDLALIGGRLHGNAVGQNAVVRLEDRGHAEPVWWPRSIESDGQPDFSRNFLQVNSIAAGEDIRSSYFSASAERPSARRPGHRNFPVDHRGVVFSGRSTEPVVRGLTRPHSARLADDVLWVLNSGYGELGYCEGGKFVSVLSLQGWTRGLCFHGNYAFVATSRVIPRFRQYAPGLDVHRSICGVHALDLRTGRVAASLIWPRGNQVFAVEAVPRSFTQGLPFAARPRPTQVRNLFYGFKVKGDE